jgi:hypothetical protein
MLEDVIPAVADIKIPTEDDKKQYWDDKAIKIRDWRRRHVLTEFPKTVNEMFMANRSKCSIAVEESDLDFYLDVFRKKGYNPVPYHWTDHVRPGEKEIIFHRKDIEPNYVPPPSNCCVLM